MTKGSRDNKQKLGWHNFPMFLFRPVIEVAHFGASKYDTYNFLKGQSINTCLDALKRHLDKFEDPSLPDEDNESKASHLGHIAWNALVAAYMLKTRPDLDDRYKPEQPEVISRLEMQEQMNNSVPHWGPNNGC